MWQPTSTKHKIRHQVKKEEEELIVSMVLYIIYEQYIEYFIDTKSIL